MACAVDLVAIQEMVCREWPAAQVPSSSETELVGHSFILLKLFPVNQRASIVLPILTKMGGHASVIFVYCYYLVVFIE